jgi:general transcription factor 3C polypeptide 3 (transcription factor C subunit 4)
VADAALKNKDFLRWNPLNKRYAPVTPSKAGEADDADEVEDEVTEGPVGEKVELPPTPTKNNPIVVTVYGQICIAAKSYQSAICAFLACFHAF